MATAFTIKGGKNADTIYGGYQGDDIQGGAVQIQLVKKVLILLLQEAVLIQ